MQPVKLHLLHTRYHFSKIPILRLCPDCGGKKANVRWSLEHQKKYELNARIHVKENRPLSNATLRKIFSLTSRSPPLPSEAAQQKSKPRSPTKRAGLLRTYLMSLLPMW